MWEWLRRTLGKKAKGPLPAPAPESIRRDPPQLQVIQGGLKASSVFDQLFELQGQLVPDEQEVTPEQREREDWLVEKVREHFRLNRPAPSAVPSISLKVLNLIAEGDASLAELSKVVAQDPAYSAALIKVANSPAYAGGQEIHTLRDVVARLGMSEVGRVSGMVAARSLFQPQVKNEFAAFGNRWNDVFAESVAAARGAAWLSLRIPRARSDQAYLAGVLNELGRSVTLRSIAALSFTEGCFELEGTEIDRVVERVHVEIGGEIHVEWNLPRFPTLVAMRHHDLDLPTDVDFLDVHTVRLCGALVQLRRQPWRVAQVRNEVEASCAALKLDGYALRSLDTQLRQEMEAVLASFTQAARGKRAVP